MVSIIIPIYNTSDYLEDCIRSVSAQSYADWECILVDDGSTDGSGKICDDAAAADSRFKVVHQENTGVSSARNRGLEEASGEYICFIDSDDSVEANYVETLLSALVSSGAGLSVCGLKCTDTSGIETIQVPRRKTVIKIDVPNEQKFVWLEKRNLLFGPCQKMYLKSVIDNSRLKFPEGLRYGEDLMFNLSYLEHIESLAAIPQSLYCYNRRSSSLSTVFRNDQFTVDYNQWKALLDFHTRMGLMGNSSQSFLYKRLWGIVYDGLFIANRKRILNLPYIKTVLSIPEIEDLKRFKEVFTCSDWIKGRILHRRATLLYLFFKLRFIK